MPLISKNLTPFYWGPKATARRPREIELAICVRGAFTLAPNRPVVAIEDLIDQGFMSGNVWDPEDLERTGPVRRHNDFSEWKPKVDLLLKGTAYHPEGEGPVCDVGWSVGEWTKALRVFGPRVYRPAILRRGSLSDPLPFKRVPLTWENAYGGPDYGRNPAGRGHGTPEMPAVEYPTQPIRVQGQRNVHPATFLPVSPNWPGRWNKVGRNYGPQWEQERAPFVSDDFDWTFYNEAPRDQQLDYDLRGDEPMVFENLHPQAPRWETRLPGVRVRALVRGGDDRIHDRILRLDTVQADLDAGRLHLTWRGHVPISELDMSDVKSVLIVQESVDEEPKDAQAEYVPILLAFEDDPIGIKDKFPPGFFEVAEAVEAAEQAEMNGEPPPDLRKVAESLPAGCPFPPWFLLAVAGDADPLGILASLPSFPDDDPLGLTDRIGALAKADPQQLLAPLQAAGGDPSKLADALADLADHLPAQIGGPLREAAAGMKAKVEGAAGPLRDLQDAPPEVAAALAKLENPPPPAQAPTAAAVLADVPGKAADALNQAAGAGPDAASAVGKVNVPPLPGFDDIVAKALAPVAAIDLPPLPDLPDMHAFLETMQAFLDSERARYEALKIDHPLLLMLDKFQRVIDKAPRPDDIPLPDMSVLTGGLLKVKDMLVAQGASLAAVAPLTALVGKVEAHMAALPVKPKPGPERRDYAYAELAGQDFSGQDLRGKSFAKATLKGASLRGADLRQADFTSADLTKADLAGANLEGAVLHKAVLVQANLAGANLQRATLTAADLTQAALPEAQLEHANLESALLDKAALIGARMAQANLTDASAQDADLRGVDLRGGQCQSLQAIHANFERANLEGADLRFADLTRCDLRQANLRGVDASIGHLSKVRGDGLDLSGAKLDMTQIQKARLRGAILTGAQSDMGNVSGTDFTGADLREVDLHKVDFTKCCLDEVDFERARLRICLLRDVRARQARFVRATLTMTSVTGQATFEGCQFGAASGRRVVFYDVTLRDCDFSHADLQEAHFQGIRGDDLNFFAASLKQAEFRKARLTRCRFVSADLNKTNMSEARVVDSQFTRANCYDAKFIEAGVANCDWLEANLRLTRWDRAEGAPQ